MKKGYTLIESLIALMVLMIVITAFLRAYPTLNKSVIRLKDESVALNLCKNEIEKIKSDKNTIQSIIDNPNIQEVEGFQITSTVQLTKKEKLILYTITVEAAKENMNLIKLSTKIMYSE